MIKRLHFLVCLTLIVFHAYSQSPDYSYGVPGTAGTQYVMGANAVNGSRAQLIYPAGVFGGSLTGIVPITTLYFFADTTVSDTITYTNIDIILGEFDNTPPTNFAWNTSAQNQLQVLSATNIDLIIKDSSWFAIPLTTPYLYNPNKVLMIDIRVGGQSPFTGTWLLKTAPGLGYVASSSQSAGTPNVLVGGNPPILGIGVFKGTNNAGIEKVPLPSVCANNQDAQVKITNSGTNVINTLTIDWSINNVPQSPILYTTPLDTFGSGNNDTIITLGNVSFTGGTQEIKAWVSSPNSAVDPFNQNDTVTFSMGSALNGSYTIGSSGTFTSISDAIAALYQYGVCGPVTFLIAPGTYTSQVEMSGRVNGASATNTITFQGVDKETTILSWSALAVNSKHVVKLQNVGYVTFRDLTIRPTNPTNAWGIHLLDSCRAIEVRNCIIDISAAGASTGAPNTVGITVSGLPTGICIPGPCATALTGATRSDSIVIDSNTFLYGYEAINFTGSATLKGRNHQITNNTILYAYQNSINLVHQENVNVSNNLIKPRLSSTASMGVGIFLSNAASLSPNTQMVISKNRIWGYGAAGISINLSNNSDSAGRGLIVNNMIGGQEQLIDGNSLYITDSRNWSVAHNSINRDFDNTTAITASGIRVLGTGNNVSILNNIISISKNGAALPVHIASTSNIDSMDRNVFHRADMSNNQVVHIGGTTYLLNNYKGGAGFNTNSNVALVSFQNDTSLYNQSICGYPTALPLSYVSTDIDNNARSITNPVVGATEDAAQNDNIALIRLINPQSPVAPGTQNFSALVQNIGSNPISQVTLTYQLNGYPPVPQTISFPSPLNPCDTATLTIPGLTFSSGDSINLLVAYTSFPNGVPDSDPMNDTLKTMLYSPLNGTYTLGGPGADFSTFSEAANALRSAGVAGEVTFMVNQGNYNEQLTISGPIPGLSKSNSITFDGVDNSTRSLSYAGNAGAPHTIRIDNVKYVTIRNLSVNTLGSAWGYGIHLSGNANACKIKNCVITVGGAGSTSTSSNFTGITLSGSTITASTRIDSVEIDSNTIYAGYHGINIYASSGAANIGQFNRVRNNNIQNTQQYGIYLYYQQTPEASGNLIKCRGANAGVGIYCQNVTTPAGSPIVTRINGNRISDYGAAGISINSSTNANASLKGRITNNVIGGSEKTAGANGLFLNSSTFWAIYNNTINRDFNNTTNINAAALRIQGSASASQGNSIVNNILSVSGFGSALPLHTQVAGNADTINYNLIYKADTSSNVILYIGSNIAFSAFKTGNFNKNSLYYRPGFTSNTNLAPNLNDSAVWSLNGRALHSPYVRTDVNNAGRPASTHYGAPDIGAFEFTPASLPPLATAVPDTIIGGTTQSFVFATDTVAKVAWPLAYSGPSVLQVRQYSGERGRDVDTLLNHMFFHVGISAFPYPSDSIMVYYSPLWRGTHLSDTNIYLVQSDSANIYWQSMMGSHVDTVRRIISFPNFYSVANYVYLSGSDGALVVPVKLLDFRGLRAGKDIRLAWTTAGEKNADRFVVEKSYDQRIWSRLASVKAGGNSNQILNYTYLDAEAFAGSPTVYYRLHAIDFNGSGSYSSVLRFSEKQESEEAVLVYPNPFSSSFSVKLNLPAAARVDLIVYDLAGKKVYESSRNMQERDEVITLTQLDSLKPGVYFISVNTGNGITTRKVIKN